MRKRILSLALAGAMCAWLPAAVNAAAVVYVRIPPPIPFYERVVPAPRHGMVWVGGYFRWSGRTYLWVSGHWVAPPRPKAVWIAPRWTYVPTRRAYVFVPGYWR